MHKSNLFLFCTHWQKSKKAQWLNTGCIKQTNQCNLSCFLCIWNKSRRVTISEYFSEMKLWWCDRCSRFERINLLFLQVSCDSMPFAVLLVASICAGVFPFSFFVMTDSSSFFRLCSVSFANGLKVLKPLFDNSS